MGAKDFDDTTADVAAITDPAERARVATRRISEHQLAVNQLAVIRRAAVAELRATGLSHAEVADAMGVTRGRAAQLQRTRFPIEREFFGSDVVTITTPLRTAGAGRPFIAQEDFQAAAQLGRFLEAVDIQTSLDQVAVSGEVDLSPPGLVLICGPKSSPVARDLIDTDPHLAFDHNDAGDWVLRDRVTGQVHVSPADREPPASQDVAYLARLRRPDGRAYLHIAGVHAIGSLGVVHYLTQPGIVHELHRAVGDQPFSMVIGCEYRIDPLRILTSHPQTAPAVHKATDGT